MKLDRPMKIMIDPQAIAASTETDTQLLEQSHAEALCAVRRLKVAVELVDQPVEVNQLNGHGQVFITSHDVWINSDCYTRLPDPVIHYNQSSDELVEFVRMHEGDEITYAIAAVASRGPCRYHKAGPCRYHKAKGMGTTDKLEEALILATGICPADHPRLVWSLGRDGRPEPLYSFELNRRTGYIRECDEWHERLVRSLG